MTSYVVAVLNNFDAENKIQFIVSRNKVKATQIAIINECKTDEDKKNLKDWFDTMGDISYDELKIQLLNAEYCIDCKEIPND